jgi:hypothetical protein
VRPARLVRPVLVDAQAIASRATRRHEGYSAASPVSASRPCQRRGHEETAQGGGGSSRSGLDFAPGAVWCLYTDGLVGRRDQPIDEGIGQLCAADPEAGRYDTYRRSMQNEAPRPARPASGRSGWCRQAQLHQRCRPALHQGCFVRRRPGSPRRHRHGCLTARVRVLTAAVSLLEPFSRHRGHGRAVRRSARERTGQWPIPRRWSSVCAPRARSSAWDGQPVTHERHRRGASAWPAVWPMVPG